MSDAFDFDARKVYSTKRSIKVWLLPYLVSNFPLDTELIENYVF